MNSLRKGVLLPRRGRDENPGTDWKTESSESTYLSIRLGIVMPSVEGPTEEDPTPTGN